MNVVIMGASPRPERFAFLAQKKLMEAGHAVFPVSRTGESILGCEGYVSITQIPRGQADTVTVYLNAQAFSGLVDDVIAAAPARIIFNPGTESLELARRFREAGIEVVNDCTLVMLEAGTF